MEEVGLMKVLCDYSNFMTCLGVGVAMFGQQFYSAFLSLHLKKRYHADNSEIGLYFGVACGSYLIGCWLLPKLLHGVPPHVQYYGSFIFFGVGAMLGGPSAVFGFTEHKYLVIAGLFLIGGSTAPGFIQCLPMMFLRT